MAELIRLKSLIGEDRLERLKQSKVLIIGLGGVGGYAAETLGRSGVGTIYLADYDKVDESNLNRQLVALKSTIGQLKVDVMKKRIFDINSDIKVHTINSFIDENNLDEYLENVDFVIDACDTVKTKLAIIEHCKMKNIRFISCMGTGNKMDPSRLKIMDIKNTSYDPLAKIIRKYVKDSRIKGPVIVVSSDEPRYSEITSPIPSNAFVPATAGLLLASYVINEIIK